MNPSFFRRQQNENGKRWRQSHHFSEIPEGKENIRSQQDNVGITVATGGMSSWLALSCRTAEAHGVVSHGLFI